MKSFTFTFSFSVLLANLFLAQQVTGQIILEVPGYGVLNGTTETSSFTERIFYSFKSVYYAEKPTPEGRFLVSINTRLKKDRQNK